VLAIDGATSQAPSIAVSAQQVVLTWAATAESRTNIYAARSTDGGRTFTTPVRVNDVEGDARVNGEQAPRVAIGDDVVVGWISKLSGQSRLRIARSTDGGLTFAPATTPHAGDLTGARGWTSLTIDRQKVVHVAWLDGRDAHTPSGAAAGAAKAAHADHGGMRQDIYQLSLRPDGSTTEARVATDVCFCCKTAVTVADEGATYVAWRHIYPTNLRDMAVARSPDGGRTFGAPVRVSEDGWQIDGCPEDGPSLAVSADGVLHIVWPTLIDEPQARKAIFYSFSKDGGRTFVPRIRLDRDDDGSTIAAHPQVAAIDSINGRVYVVWDEGAGASHRVRLRRIASSSRDGWTPVPGDIVTVSGDERAIYPAIAVTPDGAVVAWTAGPSNASEIRVRAIR